MKRKHRLNSLFAVFPSLHPEGFHQALDLRSALASREGAGPRTFVRLDNRIPSGLAMLAGVLLTLGRYSQSENSWTTLFNHLSTQNTATIASTLASAIAYGMQYLVQFGGVTMFVGGLLSYKNHVRSGKEMVGLGTSVGLADLLVGFTTGTLTLYQPLGWAGLAIAVFASRHLHGPHATYAEEVHKLFLGLKKRILREETKTRKRIRKGLKKSELARRRSRRSQRPYDVGNNKKGHPETAGKDNPATVEP